MGLDMYAVTFKPCDQNAEVDFSIPEEAEEIHYWRKHPDLHGWMENLYRQKGGTQTEMNVSTVELTMVDIDDLETVVETQTLPKTSGFFFGQSSPEDKDGDVEFIKKARKALNDGKTVAYYPDW